MQFPPLVYNLMPPFVSCYDALLLLSTTFSQFPLSSSFFILLLALSVSSSSLSITFPPFLLPLVNRSNNGRIHYLLGCCVTSVPILTVLDCHCLIATIAFLVTTISAVPFLLVALTKLPCLSTYTECSVVNLVCTSSSSSQS